MPSVLGRQVSPVNGNVQWPSHHLNMALFFEEFGTLVEQLVVSPGNLLIVVITKWIIPAIQILSNSTGFWNRSTLNSMLMVQTTIRPHPWLDNNESRGWTGIWYPSSQWYDEDIGKAKRKRRKLERHWQAFRLSVDRQMYVEQCLVVNNMLKKAMASYYFSLPRKMHQIRGCFSIRSSNYWIANMRDNIQLRSL